jgi:hypothetical protein
MTSRSFPPPADEQAIPACTAEEALRGSDRRPGRARDAVGVGVRRRGGLPVSAGRPFFGRRSVQLDPAVPVPPARLPGAESAAPDGDGLARSSRPAGAPCGVDTPTPSSPPGSAAGPPRCTGMCPRPSRSWAALAPDIAAATRAAARKFPESGSRSRRSSVWLPADGPRSIRPNECRLPRPARGGPLPCETMPLSTSKPTAAHGSVSAAEWPPAPTRAVAGRKSRPGITTARKPAP